MKKIVITLALISLLAVPAMSLAVAEEAPTPIPEAPFATTGELIDIIENVGAWIFTGLLALAAIFLVVAGYFFITAGGDPLKVNKARQMLINALIGVAIGLAARGLIAVIVNIVGADIK